MNESCETFERAISELVDGELDTPEQLAAVDHLVACASCRAFYRRMRKLGEMAVRAEAEEPGPPPEEVWRRIADEAGVARRRRSGVLVPRFALRLAAVIVLALGFALLPWLFRTPETTAGDRIVIELGSDRGAMTEERFVEITTEILRSDSRFHREMLAVMALVTAAEDSSEGTVDRAVDLDDESESDEEDAVFTGERL